MGKLRRAGQSDVRGPEVDVAAVLAISDRLEFGRVLDEIEAATGKSPAEAGVCVADWYRRALAAE